MGLSALSVRRPNELVCLIGCADCVTDAGVPSKPPSSSGGGAAAASGDGAPGDGAPGGAGAGGSASAGGAAAGCVVR